MCDDIHFIKGKTGVSPDGTFLFPAGKMVIVDEAPVHLVCPGCGHGDELHLLEDVRVERKVGEVTDEHTEYLDLDPESEDNFREVGVTCRRCNFTYEDPNWKRALKGVVVK